MIEVNAASFQYRGSAVAAVDNVNLTVEPGDFVLLLGRNGSGKSTLARLLNGILIPDRGSVRVLGMDTRDISLGRSIRQMVGLLFSNPDNQMVSTVVEEDVAFGPENLGLPPQEIRHRVDQALSLVGMEDYRKRPVHFLSGGQKQRVAIAGLLAMKPRFMVLDEPTSMLDARARKEVLQILAHLSRQEGIGVILITHFVEEAIWSDRLVVMKKGRVSLSGSPEDILVQVDKLAALGLEPLPATRLALELNQRGFNLPLASFQADELAQMICQYA